MSLEEEIHNKLKNKNVSDSSINLYLRNIKRLNGGKEIKNLTFLNKMEDIDKKLKDYKPNSRKSYLISICSILKTLKETNKRLEGLHKKYYDKMMDEVKTIRNEQPENQKTETQESNWMGWNNIINIRDKIKDEYDKTKDYNKLLHLLVLSLYSDIPPRRNADYTNMYVVKKYHDKLANDKNYFSYDDKKFIFNVYKTAKKYGQQIIDIPDNLYEVLKLYIKYHPIIKGKVKKTTLEPLLVDDNGKHLNYNNSITRILNKIFKKKISSSMLRHIYLSDKYNDELEEMKEDASNMAHSVEEQKRYMKK
jgi:integrase